MCPQHSLEHSRKGRLCLCHPPSHFFPHCLKTCPESILFFFLENVLIKITKKNIEKCTLCSILAPVLSDDALTSFESGVSFSAFLSVGVPWINRKGNIEVKRSKIRHLTRVCGTLVRLSALTTMLSDEVLAPLESGVPFFNFLSWINKRKTLEKGLILI